MNNAMHIETPWDSKVFGIYTAEVCEYSEEALKLCEMRTGLYTLKLDPLADKTLVQKYGFYYCDTLLIPECSTENLVRVAHQDVSISKTFNPAEMLNICHGAFKHGRFHRDPHIMSSQADARYDQWLEDLMQHGQVYGLFYQNELAGFVATKDHQLQLHAISNKFRGQGLAKYWWSSVCDAMFSEGYSSISSSVSASNLAVINLYSRLGFRFGKAVDVYHKYTSN